MNISFFLKPKVEVKYLQDDCSVQQALADMLESGFTAVPVIDKTGRYIGTIGEGDFLRLLMRTPAEKAAAMPVGQVRRRVTHRTVSMDASMEGLVELVTDQNFVPVVDGRGMFCGIITRHDVIKYMTGIWKAKT
ncbi:MAG: CBS domain-containing protein [Agathobaculum sp.]|jgi:CBS-domain-containing membrane protein|uniref:CBS domain-containing protein n=1 Tax=Agathobaculum sp. TaxID=2048138 RepID=UPI003D8EB0E8